MSWTALRKAYPTLSFSELEAKWPAFHKQYVEKVFPRLRYNLVQDPVEDIELQDLDENTEFELHNDETDLQEIDLADDELVSETTG